jgi:DNA anti-recombination protein RmuC
MNEISIVLSQPWYMLVVGCLLTLISAGFLGRFVLPAWRLGRELKKSVRALASIREKVPGNVTELDDIAREAMSTPMLSHLWSEYTETLHPQRKTDETGQSRIVRWRATSMAATFFTEHAIVSTPLKTEFYKHLPGILTGLGIIGTFMGLISGLSKFDVSNPSQAQSQLQSLFDSVSHAFYVSAGAISLAMIFTWIEKSLVTARYRQVEALRQLVDGMFDAGAGEEYLERLVTSSETQATQASQIKDALVADMKEILTTLTSQQVEAQTRLFSQQLEAQKRISDEQLEAQARQTGQISQEIGKAIADNLGGPMEDIAAAVKSVGASQGDAVNKMLTDVLASFAARMEDIFGGQMRGMTDLLKETSEAMRSTAEKFGELATNMDSAGKGAVEAMGERLNHAVTSMEARQQIMNKQMGEFVEQIRSMVSESQSEAGRKLQETLSAVGEQVAGVVAELRRQAEAAAESQGSRQERFERSTGEAIGSLSSQMESLMAQSVETNRSLQDTVAKLSEATNKAISDMNAGAETLFVASSDFAKAGQGVSDTMRASSEAVGLIRDASGTLSAASGATKDVLADYSRTRDSFVAMVAELKSIMDNAKRETAMTSEIISKMEAAAAQLGTAQRQSEDYLKGVNEVLVKVHESFSENVERTLREGNRQFQKELRDAVNLVSGAVKDLGDTLDDLPTKR